MKRIHIHIGVKSLDDNIAFYSKLFDVAPSVLRADYAKWELQVPAINFAISTRSSSLGINHLGIQVDSDQELQASVAKLVDDTQQLEVDKNVVCCYAKSNKHWSWDPQGIAWELFHTTETNTPVFDQGENQCCTPVGKEASKS